VVSVDERVSHSPTLSIEETAEQDAASHALGYGQSGPGFRARVAALHRALKEVYLRLSIAPESPAARSHPGEWLLDNQHVVLEALRQAAEGLPRRFYRQLPRLTNGPLAGEPRVYAVARAILAISDGHVDLERAGRYLSAYQRVSPLSTGELWAFPIQLRLAVLEDLTDAAEWLARPSTGVRADAAPETITADGALLADALADEREDPARVSIAILGLRAIAAHDWKVFVEDASRVDQWLRQDPSGVYARMEFATRDNYRKAVERLAREMRRRDGAGEEAVARSAVELARAADPEDVRRGHVGWYLVDEGRAELEAHLGARPALATAARRWLLRHAAGHYLGGIALVSFAVLAALLFWIAAHGAGAGQAGLLVLLAAVPAATIAVALVNWLVTHWLRPRLLPKLDLEEGIPPDLRTLVVVPCVLSSADEVRSLLEDLEVNYLANAGPHVSFALLSDFPDKAHQHLPTDNALLAETRSGIRALNARYGHGGSPFHLFHRERRWSPGENRWMGWERKRGKLAELNRLLTGADDTSFVVHEGDESALEDVRYVITLDADTFLPPTAAARLVGTLAHPLNRARHGPEGRVVAGYGVLQPRVETVPSTTHRTLFSRVFEADAGLDLYTRAVSDVYQDLVGEGVFAGKGIYDPPAFECALEGRVPENALLSHDLFEGVHARAGLVSDIVVFEQFPSHVLTYMRRLHRWVRGDWQLLPWLRARVPAAGGEKLPNPLSRLDRWKIIDNLRRSLLAPTLLLLAIVGWLCLPGPAWLWTLFVVGVLGTPIFLQGAATVNRVVKASRQPPSIGLTYEPPALWQGLRSLGANLWRWFLALAFLPYEATLVADAVGRTLFRLALSRKQLLEWTTAAHSARSLGSRTPASLVWRSMIAAPIAGVVTLTAVAWISPDALPAAAPLALLWIAAPQIAHWVSRLIRPQPASVAVEDRERLRLLARRTWLFFQHFLGPADHWLPPDNFQEEPGGILARRTSPTNIGLALLAPQAAYDLGYVGVLTATATVRGTLLSLERLERHRGHFLNWYDTRALAPLVPRYVSTVDSGNLAASLLVLARACWDMTRAPVLRAAQARGFLDTLAVLERVVRRFDEPEAGSDLGPAVLAVLAQARTIRGRIQAALRKEGAVALAASLPALVETDLPELEDRVVTLAESAPVEMDPARLRDLRIWTMAARQDLQMLLREVEDLAPWLLLVARPPALYAQADFEAAAAWQALRAALPDQPVLGQVPKICRRARKRLAQLEARLSELDGDRETGLVEEARAWNERLAAALEETRPLAERLLADIRDVAHRCEPLVEEMEFGFLFDRRRGLFHIGYDVTAGHEDPNYYDLLASEARLASYIAIAKGDVPTSHWLQLGRPLGRVEGARTLLSWGGTMFEYLMPTLLMRSPDHGLLSQSCRAAVRRQIAWGASNAVPWGVSESGFADLDPRGNYQYRAFGVPGLALKREVGDRLVVTPYASLLALPFTPGEVSENVGHLASLGMLGRYGLFEALDYGRSGSGLAGAVGAVVGRVAESARARRIVRSYMTHHQGMILLALDNHLNNAPMVRRFRDQPRVATVQHLLHERIPWHVPLEAPLALARDGRPRDGDAARPAAAVTWRPTARSAIPQTQVLSNGRYTVLVTAAGAGESCWRDVSLTRWRSDATRQEHGAWLYVHDLQAGELWSAAAGPMGGGDSADEVLFGPHVAEFHRRAHGLSLRLEITVAPEDDVEIRRVRILNETVHRRRIALTSYAEVALAPHADDRRHPAFSKLFVESDWLEGPEALLFRRRQRSAKDEAVHLLHAVTGPRDGTLGTSWESDRRRFLGRGRGPASPAALDVPGDLPGTVGATLDPVWALRQEVELEPDGEVEVSFLTIAGASRSEILGRLETYRSAARIEWSFQQARARAEREMHDAGIEPVRAAVMQELLSAVIHPFHALRAPAETLISNRQSRRALWAHGISGDVPILLVKISQVESIPLVREALEAHAWWRARNLAIDLVILDLEVGGYAQPVRERLTQAVAGTGGSAWLEQRGGIFLLPARALAAEDLVTIESAAAVVLDADLGSLASQLVRLRESPVELPGFVPLPSAPVAIEPTPALERHTDLLFDNGWGGFTADGREYVIHVEPGRPTPAPWSNVIANPDFGFLVTERGGGFTWATHSAENRLTPWRNDPVTDDPGEALYLRDEETAEIWTPTPGPAGGTEGGGGRAPRPAPKGGDGGGRGADGLHVVRHGAGYTIFEHNRNGLLHRLRLFAAADEPVKIVQLRLTNAWKRHRRITATYYAEWLLGEAREVSAQHIVPDFDRETGALLARNPFNETFGSRVAFLSTGEPIHGLTADRREFLGPDGDPSRPAALARIGLAGTVRPGTDPCAALQVHVDLAPGETREIHFVLGQGATREEALALAARFRDPDQIEAAWRGVHELWDGVLGAVTVATPDPALDLLVNRWLLYQTLSCRIWGRSALYQSSGAYGFRDQLQDVLALVHTEPARARAHILEAAAHQFEEGDVLHWWHPPSDEGVRTRCSDDLVWLPFVTAAYIDATGDDSILEETAPYLHGAPLGPDEHDRYTRFDRTPGEDSLYGHCLRALRRAYRTGRHDLPLIGSGDWNDGLDRVGIEGKGESVWLGWFLRFTLLAFARIGEVRDDTETATSFRNQAETLRAAVEKAGWDGSWYRRAYYDDGNPLGSSVNRECRIDNLSQSWAVFARGDPERTRRAMRSVVDGLWWRGGKSRTGAADRRRGGVPEPTGDPGIWCLFWPPFDRTARDPGYIKGYPPGVRENGGQYSHAAAWVGWAFAELGDGAMAHAVFRALSPVEHSATPEACELYRVEPYVTVADVYSFPPHLGRGGWTWYTGSAGWTYRLALEAILGIRRRGESLELRPCIPPGWPGYQVRYRFGTSTYAIRVENPDGASGGIVETSLDGQALESATVPLEDDGAVHEVRVRMGKRAVEGAAVVAGTAEGR
jgi:cyclic beta-1,2-glucan synthetase